MTHFRHLVVSAMTTLGVVSLPALAQRPVAVEAGLSPGATAGGTELDQLRFRCIGPTRGGRVTAVAGVAQRPGTFYMGTTGGGVWRTDNFGAAWRNVSDGAFASPSIGAIRVAPTDENIVWVGTGSDGLRSNVITGKGVYKSVDGGDNWQFMGLPDAGLIGAVEVHPHNPEVVFVAAIGDPFAPNPERGLYRSTDGGENWQKVLFVSERTGAVDVEFCPADPDCIYACTWEADRKPWTITSGGKEGGVYRSDDAGNSWTKISGGLPTDLVGKSDLAVTPSAPDRVYVLIEAPGDQGGLYRSDDRGRSFEHVSAARSIRTRPFYYTNVDVSPDDPDDVFVSATSFMRSKDGGKSWRSLRTTHGDHHDLWIHPERPDLWVQGNDGGASVTMDGGRTWSTLNNQPTAELYQVAVDNRFPYWLYAGQQDNSTIRVPVFPPRRSPGGNVGLWESVGGCETGPVIPSPVDPDIVYANCKGRFGVFNARTGQEQRYDVGAANMYGHNPKDLSYRFQRVAPIAVSPHDPEVVYHCSQFVHKTTDRGKTWERISPDLTANPPARQVISGQPITRDITGEEFYSCLYSLKESTLEPGLIWVGSNDGLVHVTRDGGESWTDVTPAGLPPGGRVQTVEPSPHQPGKAYVAVLLYQLGDWQPYVFRTKDYGASWTRLTTGDNGVPEDHPTRVVREDPVREGLLFCGTEWGLFVSLDDGATWQSFQLGLPVTPVTDLQVHRGDVVLSTMGRSFWVLDNMTPLREFVADADKRTTTLFAPRTAHRRHGRGGGRSVPEYSPTGVSLDYWLEEPVEDDRLELEIFDADGASVRKFVGRSQRADPKVTEADRMENLVTRTIPEPRLRGERGHHRLQWDLRYSGMPDLGSRMRGRRGPMVLPGTYRVRLVAGDVVSEQEVEVQLDPRVAESGVTQRDVAMQLALQRRVYAAMAQAALLVNRIDELLEDPASDREQLLQHKGRLITQSGTYMEPQLIDQLFYLDGVISRADQRPGRDAEDRCTALEAELRAIAEALPAPADRR